MNVPNPTKALPPYFYKFLVVSILNTIVDLAVFNLLFLMARDSQSILVFTLIKGVAFTFAVTNSYIWNSLWTFKGTELSRDHQSLVFRFLKFYGVNLTSLVLNVSVAALVFALIQDYVSVHWVSTNASALTGSLSGLLINYSGYKRVFR